MLFVPCFFLLYCTSCILHLLCTDLAYVLSTENLDGERERGRARSGESLIILSFPGYVFGFAGSPDYLGACVYACGEMGVAVNRVRLEIWFVWPCALGGV